MKVLLINYEYPPIGGGAGNATMFIARSLHRLGHPPTVLTSALNGHSGTLVDAGVTVHRLKVRRQHADRASMRDMLSFVMAASRSGPAIAMEGAFDVAIVFFALPCGPVALKLKSMLGLPYVVALRGGDVPGFVPEVSWLHGLLAPVRRRVLRNAKAIVANDEGLARLSCRTDPFAVTVIPNGVDGRFYSIERMPKAAGTPTNVLFVGRFHKQKNLFFLLDQMARLYAEAPDRWRLAMAGDGSERTGLESYARALGLGPAITWHGWQRDKSALAAIYGEADVLVNPSLYEGMPNVVLEAMACGLPVVASAIPGNSSLVRTDETGFLFELGDGDAFCAALRSIRDNPDVARRMGDTGRRRVETEFSWDRVANRYVELFST